MTKTLTYVEIDYDYCGRAYGQGACTAALGATGAAKCFNTRATCQDPDAYDRGTKTLRFVKPCGYEPVDIPAIPSVQSVKTTPAQIRPGKDLGQRSSVTVQFGDHPYHDRTLDKYWRERLTGAAQADGVGYDPAKVGTYWSKFRARNPYYQTRSLRIIQGELGQSLAEMTTRHYVMDSVKGPTTSGEFAITAKDVLKLADDDKAQAPAPSPGVLAADMDEEVDELTITPAGTGNEYPTSGIINVGNELMTFTRVFGSDEMTVVRAQRGSQLDSHSQGDSVQLVLEYNAIVSDILYDLLDTYTPVPSTFIDRAAWRTEDQMFINRIFYTLIAEPTAVKDLIGQLCEQVGLSIWWDEIGQQIRMRSVRQPDSPPPLLTEDGDFLAGSMSITEQPSKRISQVWVYYGVLDPTEKIDEARNYRSRYIGIANDRESDSEYGTPQIQKIYARWISRYNRPAAEEIVQRLLSRYSDPPRKIGASLHWTSDKCVLGDTNDIRTRLIAQPSGLPKDTRVMITGLEQGLERINIEAEEFTYDPGPRNDVKRIVVDYNSTNLNLREAFNRIYPSIESGETVYLEVIEGTILGSGTTEKPALTIGNWPSGVNIEVQLDGRVQGAGGRGGEGAGADSGGSENGRRGGDSIYTRYPVTIAGSGEIWSGGGGGGGGLGDTVGSEDAAGGGGGGAGYLAGNGGRGGNGSNSQNGERGDAGEPDAGGSGGEGVQGAGPGGGGGGPGEAGNQAGSTGSAAGGDAGTAIDGRSFIALSGSVNVLGPQVN